MTEQIITKNFYSIITSGGGGKASSDSANVAFMTQDLNRFYMASDSAPIFSLKQPQTGIISTYYKFYPAYYNKSLSDMTESEVYGANTNIYRTLAIASQNNYLITDELSNTTGVRLVTTYTNTSTTANGVINGTNLKLLDASGHYFNLIHTKFDKDIIVPPTESYTFTLDLNNLFQSFPATIGS